MTEIVETKDRKGRTRYGWSCGKCGSAAGRWPERHAAAGSASRHEDSATCAFMAEKRAKRAAA